MEALAERLKAVEERVDVTEADIVALYGEQAALKLRVQALEAAVVALTQALDEGRISSAQATPQIEHLERELKKVKPESQGLEKKVPKALERRSPYPVPDRTYQIGKNVGDFLAVRKGVGVAENPVAIAKLRPGAAGIQLV